MSIKAVILGVGRSGTTALYTLIQEMLLRQAGVDFVYEPFLWDRDVFNGRYKDVVGAFKYIDSLSFGGIASHLALPLFIRETNVFRDNRFLKDTLRPRGKNRNLLVKFIRANGRVRLLRAICPDCRFIFIIRNPVDVVNSIRTKFSFFGGEFHRDDLPRFIREVNELYGRSYALDKLWGLEEREFLYWKHMNRFALEALGELGEDALAVPYEAFIARREEWIHRICAYLGLDYEESFLAFSRRKVGSVTRKFTMDPVKRDVYRGYLDRYFQMLAQNGITADFCKSDILDKYELVANLEPAERPFYGLHGRAIAKEYEKMLKKKDQMIEELSGQLKRRTLRKEENTP